VIFRKTLFLVVALVTLVTLVTTVQDDLVFDFVTDTDHLGVTERVLNQRLGQLIQFAGDEVVVDGDFQLSEGRERVSHHDHGLSLVVLETVTIEKLGHSIQVNASNIVGVQIPLEHLHFFARFARLEKHAAKLFLNAVASDA